LGLFPHSMRPMQVLLAAPPIEDRHGRIEICPNEPRVVNGENWAVNFRDPDGHQCSFYGPR